MSILPIRPSRPAPRRLCRTAGHERPVPAGLALGAGGDAEGCV